MLWDTKDVRVARERDVERNGFWTARLGISVSTKALVPPCALILTLLLFDLGLVLILFPFLRLLRRLLNLRTPVLKVQEASLVELDLCLAVPLKLNRERCVTDDGLMLAAFAIDDLGVASIGGLGQGRASRGLQSANESPISGFVVTFLPSLALMPEVEIALLPFRFVQGNTCDTRLEEGDGEWQLDLLLTILDSLEDNSV
jgi:hypothetical protein